MLLNFDLFSFSIIRNIALLSSFKSVQESLKKMVTFLVTRLEFKNKIVLKALCSGHFSKYIGSQRDHKKKKRITIVVRFFFFPQYSLSHSLCFQSFFFSVRTECGIRVRSFDWVSLENKPQIYFKPLILVCFPIESKSFEFHWVDETKVFLKLK